MTTVPSLRRNFAWSYVGNTFYAACLWGIVSVLTKLGSAEIVGRYALATAIATPIIQFANLQLRAVLASDAKERFRFRDYLAVRLLMQVAAVVVVSIVAVGGYRGEQVAAIVLFGIARSVEAVSDVFYGYAQFHERLDVVSRSRIIKGVAMLGLFPLVFRWTGELNMAIAALILAWVVPLVVYDIPRVHRLMRETGEDPGMELRPSWDPDTIRRIVWTALPLGLVMLLIQLRITIPRTILEASHGEAALGIFSALSYLVVIGNTVIMALSQASLVRLSRAYAEGNVGVFRRLAIKLSVFGAVIGAGGVLVALVAGPWLLRIVYSPLYARHADLFVVVMLGGGILYVGSLLGAPVTAMRAFRVQLWIHGANVMILLGVGRLLIPARGMTGAAWTMVISACWITIAYGLVVMRGTSRWRQQGMS